MLLDVFALNSQGVLLCPKSGRISWACKKIRKERKRLNCHGYPKVVHDLFNEFFLYTCDVCTKCFVKIMEKVVV